MPETVNPSNNSAVVKTADQVSNNTNQSVSVVEKTITPEMEIKQCLKQRTSRGLHWWARMNEWLLLREKK